MLLFQWNLINPDGKEYLLITIPCIFVSNFYIIVLRQRQENWKLDFPSPKAGYRFAAGYLFPRVWVCVHTCTYMVDKLYTVFLIITCNPHSSLLKLNYMLLINFTHNAFVILYQSFKWVAFTWPWLQHPKSTATLAGFLRFSHSKKQVKKANSPSLLLSLPLSQLSPKSLNVATFSWL